MDESFQMEVAQISGFFQRRSTVYLRLSAPEGNLTRYQKLLGKTLSLNEQFQEKDDLQCRSFEPSGLTHFLIYNYLVWLILFLIFLFSSVSFVPEGVSSVSPLPEEKRCSWKHNGY